MRRSILALAILLVLWQGAAVKNARDMAFSNEIDTMYTNVCDPKDATTFHAYCDGETASTSTAEVIILGIVTKKCEDYAFDPADLTCPNGEAGLRISMNLKVDEANHRGCTISIPWNTAPVQDEGRTCNPESCVLDQETNPACAKFSPFTIEIDVPMVSHEIGLKEDQRTPYEYIILQQGEYFPQRKTHIPMNDNPNFLKKRSLFEKDYKSVNDDDADDEDIEVWSVIDPNYETALKRGAYYCKVPVDEDDVDAGEHECCFRGRLYSANDDDNESSDITFVDDDENNGDDDLDAGLNEYSDSRASPAVLQNCLSTNGFTFDTFAWSAGDSGNKNVDRVISPAPRNKEFDSREGYIPHTKPYDALHNWLRNGARDLFAYETTDLSNKGPFKDVKIAGLSQNSDEDDEDMIRLYASLYPIGTSSLSLLTDANPTHTIKDDATLALYKSRLNRDSLNAVEDNESRLGYRSGAWLITPTDRYVNAYARRLRCGYCDSSQATMSMPCPTKPSGFPTSSGAVDDCDKSDDYDECPIGDVSQSPTDESNQCRRPHWQIDEADDDDEAIRWTEIRHVRAYAKSYWFLGTNPLCISMEPVHAKSQTHVKIMVRISKPDLEDLAERVGTNMDFSIHDKNSYGRHSSIGQVRGDISPGNTAVDALRDTGSGAYIPEGDRIIVCDSTIWGQYGFGEIDHFFDTVGRDPFVNPFDFITNPLVTGVATCAGCTSAQQLLGLNDPDELLLWYYNTEETYSQEWAPGHDVYYYSGTDDATLQKYQDKVSDTCGKNAVGMDILTSIDGCDAYDRETIWATNDNNLKLPTRTKECDRLFEEDYDRQRTCKSHVPFIMPGALACSRAYSRFCTPTHSTPAGQDNRMRTNAGSFADKIKTGTDANTVDNTWTGHMPEADRNAPNNWLGVPYNNPKKTERAFYYTNNRRPGPAKKPAIRESVLNIFVNEGFVDFAPVFTPCISAIDYMPCMLSTNAKEVPTTARGKFTFRLSTTTPATISSQDYVFEIDMGNKASCVIGFASADSSKYDDVFTLTVASNDAIALAFECSLVKKSDPISSSQSGRMTITVLARPLIIIPIMSCVEQDDYVKSFNDAVSETILYTPNYPAEDDPCSGDSNASQYQTGGTPDIIDPTAEDVPLPDEEEEVDPENTPTPKPEVTPVPTPTALIDVPGKTRATEASEESEVVNDGPARDPTATPSATSSTLPVITTTGVEEDDTVISEDGILLWVLLIGSVVFVIGVGLLCLCIKKCGPKVDADED